MDDDLGGFENAIEVPGVHMGTDAVVRGGHEVTLARRHPAVPESVLGTPVAVDVIERHIARRARCAVGIRIIGQIEGGCSALNHLHELVQHDKFESQFQAVNGGLEDGLDAEEVCVLGSQERHVEENDENVDPYQVIYDLSGLLLLKHLSGTKDLTRFPQIETRDDNLLDAKAGHLDLLIDSVNLQPLRSRRNIRVSLWREARSAFESHTRSSWPGERTVNHSRSGLIA